MALKVGIALLASNASTGLVMALLAAPGVATEDDFFELNLAFGGGTLNVIENDTNSFWMLPTTNTSMQAAPGADSTVWEWELPFDVTGYELEVNMLSFSRSVAQGALEITPTVNGSGAGLSATAPISGAGLASARLAVNIAGGSTVGIKALVFNGAGGGATITANFTARLRLR